VDHGDFSRHASQRSLLNITNQYLCAGGSEGARYLQPNAVTAGGDQDTLAEKRTLIPHLAYLELEKLPSPICDHIANAMSTP
jgi:hypothetical protein